MNNFEYFLDPKILETNDKTSRDPSLTVVSPSGIKWTPDSNGVAAFDCRNRNWLVESPAVAAPLRRLLESNKSPSCPLFT